MNIKELLFKFVYEDENKYSYFEYLHKSIGEAMTQNEKEQLLKQYIENFIKENEV